MPLKKQTSSNNVDVEQKLRHLLESDPYLTPYENTIRRRLSKIAATETRLSGGKITLADFASGMNTSAFIFRTMNGFFVNGHRTPIVFF